VVTGFVALTAVRTLDYRDEESLWRATVMTNPSGWMPRDNLAALLLGQARQAAMSGDADALAALATEALAHDTVAAQDPHADFTVFSNMSEALRLLGRLDEALAAIDKAIARAPEYADVHWQRGRLLEISGRPDQAASAYGDASRKRGASVDMALDRVRALARAGRAEAATRELDAIESRASGAGPELSSSLRDLRALIERERQRGTPAGPSEPIRSPGLVPPSASAPAP
jgi:tetratricopeptide (TPR) repeat protein